VGGKIADATDERMSRRICTTADGPAAFLCVAYGGFPGEVMSRCHGLSCVDDLRSSDG
jgi:hypothetical protein